MFDFLKPHTKKDSESSPSAVEGRVNAAPAAPTTDSEPSHAAASKTTPNDPPKIDSEIKNPDDKTTKKNTEPEMTEEERKLANKKWRRQDKFWKSVANAFSSGAI